MKIGDKVKFKEDVFPETYKEWNGKEATFVKWEWNNCHFKCDEIDNEMVLDVRSIDSMIEKKYQPKHAKECTEDEKVLSHRLVCSKLNDIYKQKNEKYGDSFGISVRKYGLISALTRISDKFNRFEQLVLDGSNGTDDETLLDTCLDTANYFIMTAMELQERGK